MFYTTLFAVFSSLLLRFLLCFVDEITASFRRFGPLVVDWPHKAESKSYFPPKGNALKMSPLPACWRANLKFSKRQPFHS